MQLELDIPYFSEFLKDGEYSHVYSSVFIVISKTPLNILLLSPAL